MIQIVLPWPSIRYKILNFVQNPYLKHSSKQKKASQKVENMNLPKIKKLLPLTRKQKEKLVGLKRVKEKNSAPITLRGKIKTARYSTQ